MIVYRHLTREWTLTHRGPPSAYGENKTKKQTKQKTNKTKNNQCK